MKDIQQISLQDIGLFSTLNASEQEHLKALLRPRFFGANETIFIQQEPGHCMYLIRKGRVKICAVDSEGMELIFAFLSKGDVLGEMAILDGKPRSATAIAVNDTDTFYIERKEFLNYLGASPQTCIGIINILCERLREADRHLEEISFLGVSQRLARKLIEIDSNGNIDKLIQLHSSTSNITQEELAKIVGASRVMVNKILNSFVDLGYIKLGRKNLTIIDKAELNRIARYKA
jgi:CRP/FNR family transcriptional regulator, cyclic AMP receptor protein